MTIEEEINNEIEELVGLFENVNLSTENNKFLKFEVKFKEINLHIAKNFKHLSYEAISNLVQKVSICEDISRYYRRIRFENDYQRSKKLL